MQDNITTCRHCMQTFLHADHAQIHQEMHEQMEECEQQPSTAAAVQSNNIITILKRRLSQGFEMKGCSKASRHECRSCASNLRLILS
jgi:hypothetical protein